MCREPTTTEKIREERENMQKVSHRTCAETGESAVASAKGVGISAPKAAQPVYTDTGEDFELTDAEIRAWRLKNG
jgi:hypothetical protein